MIYKNYFAGIFLLLFAVLLVSCKPKVDSFFSPPVNSSDSNAKKIARRTLDVNISSPALDNLTDVYWRGFITNIFTNRDAYTVTRIDTNPQRELKVVSAQLSKGRQNYKVNTQQPINPGRYRMSIYQTSVDKFLEFEFDVGPNDGNSAFGDEEAGNYPPFEPVHRFYPDGSIFSVLDAEIGSPSFYVVALALPEKTYNQALARSNNAENIFTALVAEAVADSVRHTLYAGTQLYPIRDSFATGIDPELIYNFNQTADPDDGSLVLNESTVRQTQFYANKYLANNADFSSFDYEKLGYSSAEELAGPGGYRVIEMIVYLEALPQDGEAYNASFTFNNTVAGWFSGSDLGTSTFKSGTFTFRNAFAPSILTAKLSLKADQTFCLLSEASGRVKCLGDNKGRQTGYDSSSYIADHPYRLSFLNDIENIKDIALNQDGQTACAIFDYDANNKTSKTKCWGTNTQGGLGIGNYYDVGNLRADGTSPNGTYLTVLPETAQNVIPSGVISLNAALIDAVDQSFCITTFDRQFFCWGRYVGAGNEYNVPLEGNSFTSAPAVLLPQYDGYPIENITYSVVGNNPVRCLIGDGISSNLTPITAGVFCTPATGGNDLKHVNAPSGQFPFKIALGEGHVCVLTARKDAQGNPDFTGVTNNIYCYGENGNSELGLFDNIAHTDFVQAVTGGDTAIDAIAGARHTCYININKRMKCVGTSDAEIQLMTQDNTPRDGFSGSNYISFGKNLAGNEIVSVEKVSRSAYIICVDLSYLPEGTTDRLYGTKCWGRYGLVGNNYYIKPLLGTTDKSSNRFFSYITHTPMLRW